jgi:hypothetical protein
MENIQKHYTRGEINNARQSSSMVDLIIRQKEPNNLETPIDQVDSFLTPTELFYIRSHFPAPMLDPASYQLRIDGAVKKPFSLSYRELRDMPSETRVAILECAGNGRVFLVPQVEGAQWELGAVGNAEWTGVPLVALLEHAGMEEDACEIVLEGADQGTPNIQPIPPGPISYARSLPREKAIQREVLVTYQMNGRDLTPDHGYPAGFSQDRSRRVVFGFTNPRPSLENRVLGNSRSSFADQLQQTCERRQEIKRILIRRLDGLGSEDWRFSSNSHVAKPLRPNSPRITSFGFLSSLSVLIAQSLWRG